MNSMTDPDIICSTYLCAGAYLHYTSVSKSVCNSKLINAALTMHQHTDSCLLSNHRVLFSKMCFPELLRFQRARNGFISMKPLVRSNYACVGNSIERGVPNQRLTSDNGELFATLSPS